MINLNFKIPDEASKDGETYPLILAVQKGDIEIVEKLLNNAQLDVSVTNSQGMNAFWIACNLGHLQIAKLLFEKRIDIMVVPQNGLNALHQAVNKNMIEVAEYLISKQFPVDLKTNNGLTAVSISAFRKYRECLELLLKSNANPNLTNNNGQSPLFFAIKNNDIETAKLLLNYQAQLIYNNSQKDMSPIFLAIKAQNTEITKLFLGYLSNKKTNLNQLTTSEGQNLKQLAQKTLKQNIIQIIDEYFSQPSKIQERQDYLLVNYQYQMNDLQSISHLKVKQTKHIDTKEWIDKDLQQNQIMITQSEVSSQSPDLNERKNDFIQQIDEQNDQDQQNAAKLIKYRSGQDNQHQLQQMNQYGLINIVYPQTISREVMLGIEVERAQRKEKYDELEKLRKEQVEQKDHEEYQFQYEIDCREQQVLDEKIQLLKLKTERNALELREFIEKVKQDAQELERKQELEKLRKLQEEQWFDNISNIANQKREEIYKVQDELQRNQQVEENKNQDLLNQRKEVQNKYIQLRRNIDNEQIKMEVINLKNQVHNDYLEQKIQDKLKHARLALELKLDKIDPMSLSVDKQIKVITQRRNNLKQRLAKRGSTQSGDAEEWSEEEELWSTYKQKQEQERQVNSQSMIQSGVSDSFNQRIIAINNFTSLQKRKQSVTNKPTVRLNISINNNNLLESVESKPFHYGGVKSTRNAIVDKGIYDEIRMDDEIINQINSKIKKIDPNHRAVSKNRNTSVKTLQKLPIKSTLRAGFTAPNSPRFGSINPRSQRDLSVNEYIKNRKQIENQKIIERKRNASAYRPAFR